MTAVLELRAHLRLYPDSPTLNGLAVRDQHGNVVGMSYGGSALEHAYTSGAPVSLVVRAERVAAFIGKREDSGYLHRAVRMSAEVHRLNRLLGRYNGLRRTLSTVTVRWKLNSPKRREASEREGQAKKEAEAHQALSATAGDKGSPGTGSDPPPLNSAAVAPLLRTGPPAQRVRVAA